MNIKKFKIGQSYRSISGPYQPPVVVLRVIDRTEESVTLSDGRVFFPEIHNGTEYIRMLPGNPLSSVIMASNETGSSEHIKTAFGQSPPVFGCRDETIGIKRFQIGGLYQSRVGPNQPPRLTLKCVSRTEKSVTFSNGQACPIEVRDGSESIRMVCGSDALSRDIPASNEVY